MAQGGADDFYDMEYDRSPVVDCCSARDCLQPVSTPLMPCSMCYREFCDGCRAPQTFCHKCLQLTILYRDPPLAHPVRTADDLAPSAMSTLVHHIQEHKDALLSATARIQELESQVASSGLAAGGGQVAAAEPQVTGAEQSRIYLRDQDLSDLDARYIAKYLRDNATVTLVDLSDNNITNTGRTAIADALRRNQSVRRLVFYNNNIDDQGAGTVASALVSNHALQVVELSENVIGDVGATALADALKLNRSVTDIGLSVNSIGDMGATALAQALLVNTSLATLTLDYNRIGTEGGRQLASAINSNQALRDVNLSNNGITDDVKQLLAMVASSRPGLQLKF